MSIWFEMEEIDCPCQGDGWANIDDAWEECPMHFHGQLHPESRELLLDDPKALEGSEKDSILKWKIEKAKEKLNELQMQVRQAQYSLHLLELEKINKTATIQMQAVKIPENCYPTVQMKAVKVEEYVKASSSVEELDLSDIFND